MSILVMALISSGVMPRRRASATTKSRSSSTSDSFLDVFVIAQLLQLGQLQRVDVLLQGADGLHQTQPSKLLPMAMTSPVAFIWVPRVRLAVVNLSKGRRGIFSTQ